MKKIFVKIRDLAEGKLRDLCAGLSPEKESDNHRGAGSPVRRWEFLYDFPCHP